MKKLVMLCPCRTTFNPGAISSLRPLPQPQMPSRAAGSFHGAKWPCGVVALARQRAFVRNRTITCENPSEETTDTLVTKCRVVNADIGEWLARNGWAEAEEGSDLHGLTEEARLSGKGLWGADPRALPVIP